MSNTIPVPAGTTADDWQPEDYRIVYSPKRSIPGRGDINVALTAVQFADGRIDDGGDFEPPQVYADHPDGLTAAQARALAGLLLDAAEQLDRWVGTEPSSWRALTDQLTPEQALARVDRMVNPTD